MSGESTRPWTDLLALRMDAESPYLRIGQATVFVSDQDRSMRFYIDKLGFSLVADLRTDTGERWVAVVPPDGPAILELVAPEPGTADFPLIGKMKRLLLITENPDLVYQQWSERGVLFEGPPQDSGWGGKLARFTDPDGNRLTLAGVDRVTKELEAKRQEIAAKLEADRRSAQELEIARDVQMRLFPQCLPEIQTLDFAGLCIQSLAVGGDYYDFLDLGAERVGLVIGDVAGKGIAAALLMVSLQANLRSQAGHIVADPLEVLRQLNARFYASTNAHSYATFLLAAYDGATRQLRYVNCGHLCGLLVRAAGTVERLERTATVLGLFPDWDGEIGECELKAGDVLVLYTDGVTESPCEDEENFGEEFGESGLIASALRHRWLGAEAMVLRMMEDLRGCSGAAKFDDVTMIVAKGVVGPG